MMTSYTIRSVKINEEFEGTLADAIARATEINDEYQPAYGVQIDTESGETIWDSEDCEILVCGRVIQYDKSGVGHCWVAANEIDCPASIQDEIAGEIIDGGLDSCDDFLASNGIHYRW